MSGGKTPQCDALIYKRDTYRRTGRGRSGFEMHYTTARCSRRALTDSPFCSQHEKKSKWSQITRWSVRFTYAAIDVATNRATTRG